MIIEKCETCGLKYKDCQCCLEYTNVKDDLIECKYLCCNNNYQKKFDGNLKKQFANTCKFSNCDINKFILFLEKGFFLDDCAKFNETSFPEKEYFHSHLNMEYISDADYMHAKRFCKGFEINLGEYHDLYVHSDTLLLADAKLYGWAISQKLLIDGSK